MFGGRPRSTSQSLKSASNEPQRPRRSACRPRTRAAQGRGKWDAVLTAKKVDPACALS